MIRTVAAAVVVGLLLAACSAGQGLRPTDSCASSVSDMSVLADGRFEFLKAKHTQVWEAIMGKPLVEGMASFGPVFASVWIDPDDGSGVLVAVVKESTFSDEVRERVESVFSEPDRDLRFDLVSYSLDDLERFNDSLWDQAPPRESWWTGVSGSDNYVTVGTDERFDVDRVPADALCWEYYDTVRT